MTHQSADQDTPYHGITKPAYEKDPWDHDYYDFIDVVDANLILPDTLANRPSTTNTPDNAFFLATDERIFYRNDPNNGWVVSGHGTSTAPVPEGYFNEVSSKHIWFDQQTDAPTDSEIGSGNVAVYSKGDGNVYQRAYGGSEKRLCSDFETISPMGAELQDGSAVSMGVPVPDGSELSVDSWGVRTSEGTTPTGLLAQLTQVDGTVIGEENTSLTENVSVSVTNSSGSPTWYHFRIKNETGTDYIEGSTPDSVHGNFVYEIL